MTDSRVPERLITPDGRYIVVRERLWRTSNPNLSVEARDALVKELMSARRAVKEAKSSKHAARLEAARAKVDHAKTALGERGAPWWTDGTNYNRHLVKNTPYAEWYRTLDSHDYRSRILDLLQTRGPHKTLCPSELLSGTNKQNPVLMKRVRSSARILAAQHLVEFTQRGQVVDPTTVKGPIRLRLKR